VGFRKCHFKGLKQKSEDSEGEKKTAKALFAISRKGNVAIEKSEERAGSGHVEMTQKPQN
jgi:hypothetical protein